MLVGQYFSGKTPSACNVAFLTELFEGVWNNIVNISADFVSRNCSRISWFKRKEHGEVYLSNISKNIHFTFRDLALLRDHNGRMQIILGEILSPVQLQRVDKIHAFNWRSLEK